MNKSESILKLATALVKVQPNIPRVPFDSVNPHFKSKYASLGANIETCKGPLAKEGISLIQNITSEVIHLSPEVLRERVDLAPVLIMVGVESILMHESGEWISGEVSIPLGNGRTPVQEAGSIISYLRRYSLTALLNMYGDEDNDGNAPGSQPETRGDVSGSNRSQNPNSQQKPKGKAPVVTERPERPYNPEELRGALREMATMVPPASDKQVQLLAAILGKRWPNVDERHEVQEFLFGQGSLTEVDRNLISAGLRWVDATEDYSPEAMALKEMEGLHGHALKAKGQMELEDAVNE